MSQASQCRIHSLSIGGEHQAVHLQDNGVEWCRVASSIPSLQFNSNLLTYNFKQLQETWQRPSYLSVDCHYESNQKSSGRFQWVA
jgi:hypothetical protein